MLTLHIIRHGETEANKNGTLQGQLPGQLTCHGLEQAAALSRRLANIPLTAIYCSDLKRAIDTATPLAHSQQLEIQLEPLLRERGLGVLEGQPGTRYREAARASKLALEKFKPEQGESFEEAQARSDKFLQLVKARYSSAEIAIITHGGIVATLIARLCNSSLEEMITHHIHNTSLTSILIDKNKEIVMRAFNCTDHLQQQL